MRLVSVNLGLAHVSTDFMIAALLIYSLALLAFAGDYAFGRPRRKAMMAAAPVAERAAQLTAVGAATAGAATAGAASTASTDAAPAVPAPGQSAPGATGGSGSRPARPAGAFRAIAEAGQWVRAAATLSALGILAHVVAVTTRGLATHRAPWGDMYEFITALTCVAAIFFFYILVKYRAWAIGVFVMGAIVIALGLAETLIYTPAGPLVPALQSYWLSIHVTAMTLSSGIFFVAAVLGVMYLVAERYRKRVAAGKAEPNPLLDRIPSGAQLDKLTYRAVVFGFPIWTFGVMAGAIWADQAWGRYWGWDPVETWAFITWVIYAAYLHARATGGWRGVRSHYIQLLGFASLLTNIFVIQIFITGMHSYAGVQ
ncbi:MAG TPA: c-type cytochrome biogenesis protein CcsB [Trebonia sp.]|nr:c-type cytochrome biogenesis protein CcsB [Trebonia sp.]